MFSNYKIPFIGCINLYKDRERYENTVSEFKKVGIFDQVYFHRCDPHPKGGRYGCYDSHIKLYEKALSMNSDFALIFEDDFYFNDQNHLSRSLENAFSCMKKKKDTWDIIKMNNSLMLTVNDVVMYQDNNDMIVSSNTFHTPCYFISKKFMKEMIERGISEYHIDKDHVWYCFEKQSMYHIYPPLTYSRSIEMVGTNISWDTNEKFKCIPIQKYTDFIKYDDMNKVSYYHLIGSLLSYHLGLSGYINRFLIDFFRDC
jgi:hypothetical protein